MRDEFALEYSQLLDNLTIQEYYIFHLIPLWLQE